MRNKIGLLILVSVIALLALSGIQAYLISNTYTLEKDALIDETNEAVNEIRNSSKIDFLQTAWRKVLTRELTNYRKNDLSKAVVLDRLTTKADSLNPIYNDYYHESLQEALGYDLKFKKNLTSIVVFNGSKTDTVFGAGEPKKMKLFGENFEEEKAITTHVSTWYSQEKFALSPDSFSNSNYNFKFQIESEDLVLIEDQANILFGRLAGLFAISILIFVFVVGLLFYSIKNLVTQKKIAEIKTDFVNNLTHEFKTPLATLGIATKSLKNNEIVNSPSALNKTLKIVDRQNDRLQKLLDQVMNNSLSSKEIILNKELVLDSEYFKDLTEDFKISVPHENLVLKSEIATNEVILEIDKFHFTTAIRNILENAVKYNNNETLHILFKTKLNNSNYIITISDNGNGIAKNDQTEIFNKFYRVNSGNLHNVKGMGMGLYYTRQIIKAHKGTISVQSEPKKGSCFTIRIPLA